MEPDRKPATWIVLAFVLAHVAVRLLSPQFHYFWETDDPAIAAGVAALLDGSIGDAYRYEPQAGYYRIVEAISALTGGIAAVPSVMVVLSTLGSLAAPLLALGTFPRELSPRQRFAFALVLAANPILFWSGRYGNTATPSVALVAAAFFAVSRARTLRGEILGLACFARAVWVRADAILVAPALGLYLLFRLGFGPAFRRMAGLGLALAVFYGLLLAFDPRMSHPVQAVASHIESTAFQSHFFDYLVLSFSPIPLFLAIWGMREMLDAKARLLTLVAVWCLPTAGFYFLTLTTPRYFLALAEPLSLCGALGALAVIDRLARRLPHVVAALGVAGLASVHLVLPLDRLSPGSPWAVLEAAHVDTHDGPMHTGAFLYHALLRGGFLRWSWRGVPFGSDAGFAQTSRKALAALAASPRPRRVFVAVQGFPECALFYELHRAGGVPVEKLPVGPQATDTSHIEPTRWRLGRSEVVTVDPRLLSSDDAALPMGPFDEAWISREQGASSVLAKLAKDVEPAESPGAPFSAYRPVRPRGATLP